MGLIGEWDGNVTLVFGCVTNFVGDFASALMGVVFVT